MKLFYYLLLLIISAYSLYSQEFPSRSYNIGNPVLTQLYVNPSTGNDNNSGKSQDQPYKTLDAAWRSVPENTILTTGYQINLMPSAYECNMLPNYMENRIGSAEFPIIIRAFNGKGSITLPCGLNIFNCVYLYLLDLQFIDTNATADIIHLDHCNHILIRDCLLHTNRETTQECMKINQTKYAYIEDCDISGAADNAFDAVGLQYGHIVRNKIHSSGDWAIYTKGGSAYLWIEGNEIYDGGAGGYTAGQGTGFQFMTSPWIHYEAEDIKFVNNIIHDCDGAAFGTNGGYNILFAHNTAYRTGSRSHTFEAAFGNRSCDGDLTPNTDHDSCAIYISRGGWGNILVADGDNYVRIPNKNIFVYNNIFYNPANYAKGDQFLQIFAPYSGEFQANSNVPTPTKADDNLQIAGNIFSNGSPSDFSIGIEYEGNGCQPDNPNCNKVQLQADNTFNTFMPEFVNPENGDFHPLQNGNLFTKNGKQIPNFPGNDRPMTPSTPNGNYTNSFQSDFDEQMRNDNIVIGAFSFPKKIVGMNETITESKTLLSILPNPASNFIQIQAKINCGTFVSIELYSLLSKHVIQLYDGMGVDGKISVQRDISSLASGMYYIRLISGSENVVIPCAIIR
ncbi:MAG: right-handed parallel beta-helix repeat-containing protein [Ignavibacteriae bacterium]|nr:right-handed parallel beta-helix repeat-containing protein [Ignavibacteriota bacterium]